MAGKKYPALYKNGTRFKNESAFKSWASKLFRDNGWVVYTTPDFTLRGGQGRAGFPDIIAYKAEEEQDFAIAIELKMPGNYPDQAQKGWTRALGAVMPSFVFWPKDEEQMKLLARRGEYDGSLGDA